METTNALSTRGGDLAQGTQNYDGFPQGEVVKGRMGEIMGSMEAQGSHEEEG